MLPGRQTPRLPLTTTLAGLLLVGLLAPAAALADGPLDDTPLSPGEAAGTPEQADRTLEVGTLNVLGSQHTRGPDRRRTIRTARLVRRHDLKLAGLQEVQEDQYRWLRQRLPRYRIWPGLKYGAQGIRLQIAWRRSRFEQLDHGTITTTFSHQQRPIPWVRLRDERTGRRLFLIDIHNSPVDQERARDRATREEIRLFKRLRERRGAAVLIVGDANERREWFCRVTGHTAARAANGGSHTRAGCEPPEPTFIDWLMGAGRFGWRNHQAHDTRVSDHPLHTAVLRWGRGR